MRKLFALSMMGGLMVATGSAYAWYAPWASTGLTFAGNLNVGDGDSDNYAVLSANVSTCPGGWTLTGSPARCQNGSDAITGWVLFDASGNALPDMLVEVHNPEAIYQAKVRVYSRPSCSVAGSWTLEGTRTLGPGGGREVELIQHDTNRCVLYGLDVSSSSPAVRLFFSQFARRNY